ncbi:hypothetical protein [Caldanaerobacter sp.]|uniref:hypothetical protein n=1 Tax=Caldanaerobacter sp. TaxID=2930036 RepID=UPI003C758E67
MAYLNREQILQIQDLPTEDVEVPEWGGKVRVRGLTGAERDKFEASIVVRKGNRTEFNPENMRAKLVAMCVVDENGNRLFTDEDIKILGQKSATALDRIFQVAQKLSGLRPEDFEEMQKN